MPLPSLQLTVRVLAAACLAAAAPAWAAPSTFGQVIGNALLCRSVLDTAFYYNWMNQHFGAPYKREGGAWWFKTEANLWGSEVKEVMVSDDSSSAIFVAAIVEGAPDKLDQVIRLQAGPRHESPDTSQYPNRAARPGSHIVYFQDKSKIYCLSYNAGYQRAR